MDLIRPTPFDRCGGNEPNLGDLASFPGPIQMGVGSAHMGSDVPAGDMTIRPCLRAFPMLDDRHKLMAHREFMGRRQVFHSPLF